MKDIPNKIHNDQEAVDLLLGFSHSHQDRQDTPSDTSTESEVVVAKATREQTGQKRPIDEAGPVYATDSIAPAKPKKKKQKLTFQALCKAMEDVVENKDNEYYNMYQFACDIFKNDGNFNLVYACYPNIEVNALEVVLRQKGIIRSVPYAQLGYRASNVISSQSVSPSLVPNTTEVKLHRPTNQASSKKTF